ncbi:MAG: divergent polysaccharide deacetylase family protein [Proteobacteria bacterium]|nr:divergent polysaccharide deacetylase family protein [Pseudomonadota bacterium]
MLPILRRKPSLARIGIAAPQRATPDLRAALKKPAVAGSGAVSLIAICAVIGISVAGDPAAGAPSVRIPLQGPGAPALPTGWRDSLPPEAPEPGVTLDTLTLGADVGMAGVQPLDAQPIPTAAASAVITLPGGGRILGSAEPEHAGPRRVFASNPLAAAPLAGLSAQGPEGPLPIIGSDGRTPAQAYARPFQDNGKPKVSLVIGGLGLNAAATRSAIETLPPEVTLSFVPYADGLQGWIDLARANGHEVLLEIPMEPMDYPANDPGPYTLLAQAEPADLGKRMDWLLSRAQGYFGVTNYLGGRFLASDAGVGVFAGTVKKRGLAFLDDGQVRSSQAAAGLPRASADRVLDDQLSPESISRELAGLETTARDRGHALGSGFAYPLTLQQVARWAEGLSARGFQLAPASAMTRG